jgi:hypothetical protein
MTSPARVKINPDIVRWAINRLRSDAENLSDSIKENIDNWLRDEKRPTFSQAQDLAKSLRIPFALTTG